MGKRKEMDVAVNSYSKVPTDPDFMRNNVRPRNPSEHSVPNPYSKDSDAVIK